MTNKVLSSEEALSWGLLNYIYDDKYFWNETVKLADNLSKGPTLAYGKTKRLVHNSLNSTLETQMELETKMISESAETNDGQKGCLLYTSPSPRDGLLSRMPSSA